MASTSEEASSLITKLEISTSTPIYSIFIQYLSPFSDLTKPQEKQKKTLSPTTIRSLAKKYLQFLNKSLSILPKRLSKSSDLNESFVQELFDVYMLCLDCLEVVSSQLSCKPWTIQLQRLRMVHCLDAAGKYVEGEREGFRVLKNLRGCGELDSDKELAMIVGEVVTAVVKCVALEQSKDKECYRRILEEIIPCFGMLDASVHEKLHRLFTRCTLFLVVELTCSSAKLVRDFCSAALSEYSKSSMRDQIYKFSHRLCSSLFSLDDSRDPLIVDLLKCVLSTANACKVHGKKNDMEFTELVSYCANKCRTSRTTICSSIARYLIELADDLILKIYATGLHFISCNFKFQVGEVKDVAVIKILKDDGDGRYNVAVLLKSLESYYHNNSKENNEQSSVACRDSMNQNGSRLGCNYDVTLTCIQRIGKANWLSYINALNFLCLPLAELVNSEKRQILAEFDAAGSMLFGLQDIFHQFCTASLCSFMSGIEREEFDDNKAILSVAVAAFILSIGTHVKLQNSVHLIKQTIEWMEPHDLKRLLASLYNIGVLLHRNKRVNEALEALKLSCKVSWRCIILLCQRFAEKSKGIQDDLSEKAIVDFVMETCTRSAFLLDVLHQRGSPKFKKIVSESLKNWCVARNLFNTLPGPMILVKQWVKIACKLHKNNVDTEDSPLTLSCLLASSDKVSNRMILSNKMICIILEQELLAYAEMSPYYPEISQRMQMKIIDILLGYVKPDSLQKSRILLRKGRALRAYGIERLRESILCLTEAISIMNSLKTPPSHQLAAAHCLRALCNQEAEPSSKQILEDIKTSIEKLLSLSIPDDCTIDDKLNVMSENTLLLLYNILDLLCLKGHVNFHHDIYELFIRLFKRKNVPLEKILLLLWGCRRLSSHALCVSPVNDIFIRKLSEHYEEELPKSIDYWIRCFEDSRPLTIGFEQIFSFLFANFPHDACVHESSFQLDITADEVKEAASELLVLVPESSHSAFFAGYLYYDLCERLISNGRLFEALSYAKEAHQLRTQLFQEKFRYSVEQEVESLDEAGDTVQKVIYGIRNFQVHKSVASEVWSFDSISWEMDGHYLSAWNVLQSYLESTLQLGIILELIGNGVEAEAFLLWGKNVSCLQSLPLFTVAFSSVLGKIYRKKQHLMLAKKELQRAEQILEINDDFACIKCRLILEASVNLQLGDLYRSDVDGITKGVGITEGVPAGKSSHAYYMSALNKLNTSEWKNSITCPEEVCSHGTFLEKTSVKNQQDAVKICSAKEETKGKMVARKPRNKSSLKALAKEKDSLPEQNGRVTTRSKSRSSQNPNVGRSREEQHDLIKHSESNNISSYTHGQTESPLEMKTCIVDFGSDPTCICKNLKCWNCLPREVLKSGMIKNFIHVKWEFVRRQLSLRLLTGKGKCLGDRDQIHEIHENSLGKCLGDRDQIHEIRDNIVQSISVLVSRNPFCHAFCTLPLPFLLGKQLPGDVFAVERAAVLYSLSWFSMKSYHSKDDRSFCCDLSPVELLLQIVSWLKLAFVLCREVPILFQKVARLLAVIYIFSASKDQFSLSSSSKAIPENDWASYFHQASVGTHLDYQFFSIRSQRCRTQHHVNSKELQAPGSVGIGAEISKLLRLAPDSIKDLDDQFVRDFFTLLPSSTIICISLLGGPYAKFIQDFLCYPSTVNAWMLLSRLNSKGQPVVVLLPVNSISEELSDDDEACASGKSSEGGSADKHWRCPWGSGVVDNVAPTFRMILEENYLSSSVFPLEDTKEIRNLWWTQRKRLDSLLGKLLRKLEDSWLGQWRFLLKGEWSNSQHLDAVLKKVVRDLKSKCQVNANETLLKLILGGSGFGFEQTCIPCLALKKCCHFPLGCRDEESCGSLVNSSHQEVYQIINEAFSELDEASVEVEPIILVMDSGVQMLPWENLPILRNQEVYRMPSVASISAALERICQGHDQVGEFAAFPVVDPLDAFYLLNPSGDLNSTQLEFENWFKDHNLEGKAGSAPPAEELAIALKSHDLFIYFGHGSGSQYVSRDEIKKLDKCAATLLMGCSSGSLKLNGSYIPQGMPLTYLLGGSPITIANLWEVTDKDIDRFGKAMLDSWIKERASSIDCDLVAKELEALSIKGCKGNNAKKKASRKKLTESDACKSSCNHRPKIGSFMSRAREACVLPFLIGAAPVCYGVPTCVRRKNDR